MFAKRTKKTELHRAERSRYVLALHDATNSSLFDWLLSKHTMSGGIVASSRLCCLQSCIDLDVGEREPGYLPESFS